MHPAAAPTTQPEGQQGPDQPETGVLRELRTPERDLLAESRSQRGGPVLALPPGVQVELLLLQGQRLPLIPLAAHPLPMGAILFSGAASYEVGHPAAGDSVQQQELLSSSQRPVIPSVGPLHSWAACTLYSTP